MENLKSIANGLASIVWRPEYDNRWLGVCGEARTTCDGKNPCKVADCLEELKERQFDPSYMLSALPTILGLVVFLGVLRFLWKATALAALKNKYLIKKRKADSKGSASSKTSQSKPVPQSKLRHRGKGAPEQEPSGKEGTGDAKSGAMSVEELKRRRRQRREGKIQRFNETGWYTIWYPVSILLGAGVIAAESEWWLPGIDNTQMWHNWPAQPASRALTAFYFLQLAFNLQCLIQITCFELKKKDYWEMVTHHVVTILLIASSLHWDHKRIGLVIVTIVADLVDTFLYSAKLFHYMKFDRACDTCFVLFALSFFGLRGAYYPAHVLKSVITEHPANAPWHWYFTCLLSTLYVLYIYWMILIAKMAFRMIVVKKVEQDIRSDSEELSSEDEDDGEGEN